MKKENFKIKKIETADLEGYEGFIVILENEKEIKKIELLIENGQSCCEDFGYMSSEDNFDKFIGSKVKEIITTDTERASSTVDFINSERIEEGQLMFLTLETSKGVLQFVVYNIHNGYYGHTALIRINNEIIEEETL